LKALLNQMTRIQDELGVIVADAKHKNEDYERLERELMDVSFENKNLLQKNAEL
jgi:hypothetical protein